jgi:fucose permease
VIAYTISGFGGSLEDAQANGFVANYKDNAAAKMGFLHAAYGKEYSCSILPVVILTLYIRFSIIIGLGALASPVVATQFAQLHRWSFHYLVSLAVAALNVVLLICTFKFKTQDGEFTLPHLPEKMLNFMFGLNTECLAQIGQTAEEKELVGGSKYKEMFKLKALHTLALFILVYVGVEVTISGKSPSKHCRAVYNDTVRP